MNKPQFIRSNAPHIVEVAEGSHDARSNFGGERGPDGRWTEIDTGEFVHDKPPSELKTASFDHSGTISGPALQGWDLHAPPSVPASAALGRYVMEPNPGSDQPDSHFSERITQPDVEVPDASHAARSNLARFVTDVRQTEIDASEFVHDKPPTELKTVSFDRSGTIPGTAPQAWGLHAVPPAVPESAALGAYVMEPNPGSDQPDSHFSERISQPDVEVAEGSPAARGNLARLVTDVRRTKIDASEFVRAEPPPELNPVPFNRSSTLPGSAPQVLDPLEVSPNPQPNTSAPPAVSASAVLGAQVIKPSNPSGDQAQSHLSARIGELKAANNQVRAALKRIESEPPNKA